jgi:hypothetical protein
MYLAKFSGSVFPIHITYNTTSSASVQSKAFVKEVSSKCKLTVQSNFADWLPVAVVVGQLPESGQETGRVAFAAAA